jgi:hypothetical protein
MVKGRRVSVAVLPSLILAASIGGLIACASYTNKMAVMREAFDQGDYDRALKELAETGLKDRSEDRLLWNLESATIFDRKGEYAKSRKLWFEADRIADELFTVSVSKTAKSVVVSESSTDYEGEDYEKVAIHAMLAHQYIGLGLLNEAVIQARKINTKLNEISQKFNPDGKYRYREDAHARYLSALIYESRGELDSAIVDYRKAVQLYEGDFSDYIIGRLPKGVVQGLYRCLYLRKRTDRLKEVLDKYGQNLNGVYALGNESQLLNTGEIVVVHELGRVARKFPKEQFLTVGDQLVRFSSPIIKPNPLDNRGTGVLIEGRDFYSAENTIYFDAVAKDSLENRRARMVAKQMARLVLKGQINYQTQKNFGPLAGLAVNVLNNATETADTRSWSTLPQAFFVTRIRLAPGRYQMVVKTNGLEEEVQTVDVSRGRINLLRSFDR